METTSTIINTTKISLIFDFSYEAYGKHYNRTSYYPVKVTGKMKHTFSMNLNEPMNEQLKEIKNKMIESVKELCRKDVFKYWKNEYDYEDEEIANEKVKIMNTREPTKWSDLDDA